MGRYGLKSYTRVLTGRNLYRCGEDGCDKAFKTSGDLQKHVRTLTGQYGSLCVCFFRCVCVGSGGDRWVGMGSNLTQEFLQGETCTDVGRTGVTKLPRRPGIYRNTSESIQVNMAAYVYVCLFVCFFFFGGGGGV